MSLLVLWDTEIGRLERTDERSREYAFRYTRLDARPISLSLPVREEPFSPADSRPFFEALLPEGALREQIAQELRLAPSDGYGLLERLGRDCAGALQIVPVDAPPVAPAIRWLDARQLDELVEQLPRHPLGIRAGDRRLRLSLAGVQRKAVLARDDAGRFGEPLDGMPSTHILKPDPLDPELPGLAVNECYCMRLADRCGMLAAPVDLIEAAERPCLVVERFDRDRSTWPPTRVHQEDLCQALGLTPDVKYLKPDPLDPELPGLAVNECYCMRLADRCGMLAAPVDLIEAAERPCLVVERFDRDRSTWPPTRVHQEDLCQALGLTPDVKYQHVDWQLPSYRALADLLDRHSPRPGVDRLFAARAAVFHFLVGNADAHAKNVSLLHGPEGVRLAPLYDVVATAAYPHLGTDLALAIGEELDPARIGVAQWSDLARDFGLHPGAFAQARNALAERALAEARALCDEARAEGWHHPVVDRIVDTISARAAQLA